MAPDFWSDSKAAQVVMKELKSHKNWVKEYDGISGEVDDLEVLFEFWKEGEATEEEVNKKFADTLKLIEDAEFRSTLNAEEDELSAILQINAGAGGDEACDWASILFRMYSMWAKRHGYKTTLINQTDGDVAGIRSVEMAIEGDYVYGYLKGENGVHRLVRVSPFNAQGKRMTSFASVFIHPQIDDSIEVEINPADLKWDVFRASGAGGQHVNRTESAVRVTHLPTKIAVECQAERSQHMNRETALKGLKSRLYAIEIEKKRAEKQKIEDGKMKNEWGSQIRSYVLDDRWVKDLRTGYKVHNPDPVLNGEIDEFLKSYLMSGAVEKANKSS